jgi:hypothetical protein
LAGWQPGWQQKQSVAKLQMLIFRKNRGADEYLGYNLVYKAAV